VLLSNEEMRSARLNPLASGARRRIPRAAVSSTSVASAAWLKRFEPTLTPGRRR